MSKDLKNENTRNYGIDLLRIFSMFLVVMLHSLGRGGILYNAIADSWQYKISWLMEIMAYPAVDIFALISGYVSYSEKEKKTNYTNYLILWLEVVFYGVLITIIFDIIDPTLVSVRDYIIVLFPITNQLYWYFTAYTGLFIIMPLINNGIRNTSEKMMKAIFGMVLVFFSIFDSITKGFILNDGYAFVWLLLLYILGAAIKKCRIDESVKTYKIIGGIIIFYVIAYLYKIHGFDLTILNINITNDLFVSYTSPTVLMVAILYVIGFSKIKFNSWAIKIIKFLAPSAFAIYLLNNHRLIWNLVMNDIFLSVANDSIIKVIIYPLGFSVSFVIIAILIDKIRQFLFRRLHIKDTINKLLSIVIKN